MRVSGYYLRILCLMLFVSSSGLSAQPDYLSFKTQDESNNIEIFKNASPSVVYVTNKAFKRDYFSFNVHEIPQGTGTGFVWDASGIIVTNYHVIQGASLVTVTLQDGTELDAKIIGVAPGKDLAVLKVNTNNTLSALPVGDSSLLEVGRKVVAIGNPFGLDTTLTVGVVSALGREIDSVIDRKIRDVIQTDASINPGNSGGPLLNSLGQLIGVNTAIYSPSGASAGIGFAIPVNTVKKIVPQLIEFGRVVRPILGVETAPDYLASRYGITGVLVVDVTPGLSAHRKGIIGITRNRNGRASLGDIIVEVEGQSISNNDELLSVLEQHKVGDSVQVITERAGRKHRFNVQLAPPQ